MPFDMIDINVDSAVVIHPKFHYLSITTGLFEKHTRSALRALAMSVLAIIRVFKAE